MVGTSYPSTLASSASEAPHKRAAPVSVSFSGQQSREDIETPGDPARILEFLAQRHRLRGLRARLPEVLPNDAQPRRCRKQDAQAPYFTGASIYLDRFIVELLRSFVVAVPDGDVGQDRGAGRDVALLRRWA